jgi:hypothetical protein
MAIKQIKLHYSTFDLEYDAHKHWSHDDTALIDAVEKLVAYEGEKNKLSNERYYAHASCKKEMEPVENSFAEISVAVKDLAQQADDFDLKLTGFNKTNIDELIDVYNVTGERVTAFHEILVPLSNTIMALYPVANAIEEDMDPNQIDPVWEHFNNIKSKHYQHWEKQSINISSFDDLEQRMRAHFDNLEKQNENNRYYVNDILLNYNVFIAKVDGIYLFWEELQKRIILLNRFYNNTDSIEKIQKLN